MQKRRSWLGACLWVLLGVVGCDGETPPPDGGSMGAMDAGEQDGGGTPGCVEGAACGTSGTCRGGECVVCGDGVVHSSEECDDGNDVAFDGCEPTTCRFTCREASDCADANPCNGVEDCPADRHFCVPGTPPAAGTECTTATVADGVCSAAGLCVPAGCSNGVVDAGEECDDGNMTPGDGCEPDCTFTCTEDADCLDSAACNGEETCDVATHTCVAGTPPTCTASDACHVASCSDLDGGCIETLIDEDMDGEAPATLGACGTDCDDRNPERRSGNVEICGNGIDDDCDPATSDAAMTLYYPDCDNDGFASMGASGLPACMAPANCGGPTCGCITLAPTSPSNSDCRDNNANVRPNQTMFFTSAISGAPPAVDYDYNCDGIETQQVTCVGESTTGTCPTRDRLFGCEGRFLCPFPPCCSTGGGGGGWTGTIIPACGTSAQYSFCEDTGTTCVRRTITRTQACR